MGRRRGGQRVARDCAGVRVLVLTMHEEKSYVARLIALGAADYLLKRTAAQELVRAIRAVAAGGTYFAESTTIASGAAAGLDVPGGRERASGGGGAFVQSVQGWLADAP